MSWQLWANQLRQAPRQAVADLLRGVADIGPFERAAPYEFLLAVLPRSSRNVSQTLLGEPPSEVAETDADLPAYLDTGLAEWLLAQRGASPPPARKLGAYAAQVCEALQWPLYFALPETRAALRSGRALWLPWLATLTLSAYRDPEYDYWQALASRQDDDSLQFFWQSFVVEAGRLRSGRYLNLGLLALARLPLSEEDGLRNLRLQVQALINRYQRRKGWGVAAHEELAESLRGVMARNPCMNADRYRAFLGDLLAPLGEDKTLSVLSLVGLLKGGPRYAATSVPSNGDKLKPPGSPEETEQAVYAVRRSSSLAQAWRAIHPLLNAHEDYLHKSGDAYYFVRNLDRCARALCEKYPLREPEISARLFQWIHLALRVDADDPRRWMLWELALRQADQPHRAQWVLWEMTRRFPGDLHCRLELARLLADSNDTDDQVQADRLLRQLLQLDPRDVHAHSTLAQLAIRRRDWSVALDHARQGLRIKPDDQASALLLATARARRKELGDLQTAIDDLSRFVNRYPGNLKAEGYLRDLLRRQQLAAQGKLIPLENDEAPTRANTAPPETDDAWRAFADSIQAMLAATTAGEIADASEDMEGRVLPLPQALRRAVAQGHWDADVLDHYPTAEQREFPLETRLWRYLRTLQSGGTGHDTAKQAVQAWLDAQTNESPWFNYLNTHWQALQTPSDQALSAGAEWLKDLLDRYHPLPMPLLA